jgi:hypothetical protein
VKRNDDDGRKDEHSPELKDVVPKAYWRRLLDVVRLTDAFCDGHLNEEYKLLCREMAVAVCQAGSPVLGGKSESWAAGIVWALGRVNFLTDPTQDPHMTSAELAQGLGVSVSNMQAKGGVIRDLLDLAPLDPNWCLKSLLADNPMVWMVKVDGFVMDVRDLPRDAQVVAYEKGLIPWVPADRQDRGAEDET